MSPRPLIDVTEVLSDPDVAGQTLIIYRRTEVVGANGRAALQTVRLQAVGSVTPAGDNSLVREEAYTQQLDAAEIISTFRLRGAGVDAAGQKFQPDIVQCDVGSFVVREVNDYSPFGAGMVVAQCVSYPFNPTVPQ